MKRAVKVEIYESYVDGMPEYSMSLSKLDMIENYGTICKVPIRTAKRWIKAEEAYLLAQEQMQQTIIRTKERNNKQ